jgi:hypothetical protein
MARTQFQNNGEDSLAVGTQATLQFALDTFTASNGTGIGSRSSDSGHSWFQHPTLSPSAPGAIQDNEAYGGSTNSYWYLDAEPPTADYSVKSHLNYITSTSVGVGVLARLDTSVSTGYFLQRTNTVIALRRLITGTSTVLGTDVTKSIQDCTIELIVEGSTIRCFVIEDASGLYVTPSGGESSKRQPCITATDTQITAAGRPGIQLGNGTATTRTRSDDFTCTRVQSEVLVVNDGTKFPAAGDYPVVVSSDDTYEIMKVTDRNTDDLIVERAQEGTTAQVHPPGSKVTQTLTGESLRRYVADEVEMVHDNIALGYYGLTDVSGRKLTETHVGRFYLDQPRDSNSRRL